MAVVVVSTNAAVHSRDQIWDIGISNSIIMHFLRLIQLKFISDYFSSCSILHHVQYSMILLGECQFHIVYKFLVKYLLDFTNLKVIKSATMVSTTNSAMDS